MVTEHKSLADLTLSANEQQQTIVLDLCAKNDWFNVPYNLLNRIKEYGLMVEGFYPDAANQACIQLELAVFNDSDIRDIEYFVIKEEIIIADWHWAQQAV
jgi:hypothetical protein